MSTQKLKRQLRAQYPEISDITNTGSGHLKVHLSNDRFVICAASPSGSYTIRQVGREIRRQAKLAAITLR